jgi:hypothetical protein
MNLIRSSYYPHNSNLITSNNKIITFKCTLLYLMNCIFLITFVRFLGFGHSLAYIKRPYYVIKSYSCTTVKLGIIHVIKFLLHVITFDSFTPYIIGFHNVITFSLGR